MDKSTKKQLVEMQSLMERMDKHYTKDQAAAHVKFKLINEGLVEDDKREITGDRFKDYVGKIQKGWQVHVGYVTTVKLSLDRTYPTQDSYDYLSSKLDAGTGEKFKEFLGTSMDDMKNFIDNHSGFQLRKTMKLLNFKNIQFLGWIQKQSLNFIKH